MRPLPFVWPYAAVFWIGYLWAFWPEFRVVRQAKYSGNTTDSKSLQVIVLGMWLGYAGAFPLAFIPAFHIAAHEVAVFWIGMAVMVSGSLLRRHCFRMLGESFTGDVRARADQQVVTRGAYSVLRHPAYTAGTLMNIGIGVALGSWASALLLGVTSFAVYAYRIAVEERALVAVIGEPYREFMSTRKRLIPFVY
jgi:protein-S-isoprenylcysteine O-methyltransferase Ste14